MKPSVNEVALLMQHLINNYYINPHGCWIHRNKPKKDGYVLLRRHIRSKKIHDSYLAHRLSYALYKGYVPDGMQVLHTCDVPPCINPDHLFLGTITDNMRDMSNKKRGLNQLTEDDIAFICILRDKGWSQEKIGKYVGVNQVTVSRYLRKVV